MLKSKTINMNFFNMQMIISYVRELLTGNKLNGCSNTSLTKIFNFIKLIEKDPFGIRTVSNLTPTLKKYKV